MSTSSKALFRSGLRRGVVALSNYRYLSSYLLFGAGACIISSLGVRTGDGEPLRKAFEPLFIAAGVDAIFTGHVHRYVVVLRVYIHAQCLQHVHLL